jgi:cell division septum initiation protein DivIVA
MPHQIEGRHMSKQGLSIFDTTSEGSTDEATQVIPLLAEKPAAKEASEPSQKRAPQGAAASTATQENPVAQAPAQRRDAGPERRGGSAEATTVAQPPTLPTVRRGGYDTAAVDSYLRTASAERAGLAASLTEAQSRLQSLHAEVEALRTKVEENEHPTYAGLGGKASEMLRLAEEQASDVLEEATAHAAQIRQQAQRDAASVKAEAERDAEDMRVVQMRELEESRSRTMADIEAHRTRALAEADDHLASARREAEQHRLAAEQETNALRTSAAREAEQARATADREVQEAMRTLAVEKERLTREAAEHHDSAVAETQRLVAEAEERANAAEQRAHDATEAANAHRAQAAQEAEQLVTRSRREAEQIVSAAKKQADALRNSGHADSERELAALKAEVTRLTRRRDSITAQLSALRDVVAGFGTDDES